MTTFFWLKLYLLTVPVFFVIDMIWLGIVARGFYKEQLQALLSPTVNWPAAFVFYGLYIAGVLFFAVRPGLEAGSLGRACLFGALFGFITYATYDLTNLATVKDWPVLITVIDLAWGSFVSGITSLLSFLVIRRVFNG